MPADTHAHLLSIATPRAVEVRPDEPGQCATCRHCIRLAGTPGNDWGVCSAAASSLAGLLVFEHTGCGAFAPVPDVDEDAVEAAWLLHAARDAFGSAGNLDMLSTAPVELTGEAKEAAWRLLEAAEKIATALPLPTLDATDDVR